MVDSTRSRATTAADVELVGREVERRRLNDLVERAADGHGAAIVVRGEPGVGKTALLSAVTRDAGDCLLLSARGVEAERELAYAGLAQLLNPVLELRSRLPTPRRAALESALGLGEPTPGDRFATYAAALGLLAEAAETAPVLATVDDAHLVDQASAEALRFCARRLDDDRVCLIFTARDTESERFEAPELVELPLAGLREPEVEALVRRLADTPVAAADVVAAMAVATAGNPLSLVEIVRLLDADQLTGRRPLPDPLPVGPGMVRAFGSRIERLPDQTQTALLLAAAEDSGDLDTLVRALHARDLDVSALEPAEAAGLITLAESRLEFRHPLLRSAAYHRAGAPARRDAHAALAVALLPPPRSRARRAWHLAAAAVAPDEEVAQELEAAAAEAGLRAAPAAAAKTLQAAARLTPDAVGRARRLLEAARSYHLAGAPEHALRLLDEALETTADPLFRAEIQHTRARVQGLRGSPAEVRSLLLSEARRVEPHDPGRAVAMLLEAAMASTMLGEPRETLRLAERSSAMAETLGGELRVMAGLQLGMARIMRGDAAHGLPLLEQARPLLHGSDLSLWGYLGPTVAMANVWVGRYEDARRSLVELLARAREQGALSALPWCLHALSVVEYFLGDWPAGRALATEAVALAEEIDQPVMVSVPSVTLATIAGGRGEFAEAREHAQRAIYALDQFGVASVRTAAGWAQGLIELAEGHHDEASAVLETTGHFALERGLEEPGVILWAQDLAEAYIRSGRLADADATLQVLEAQAARTGHPLGHAGACRGRGLLADGFEAHFERALSWHGRVPVPFERARTELCFGERLRRARQRSAAREPLRRALATFEALGAEPWAERARREIGATGERARKREPSTADQLTPQELQVAQLVAGGATNKEAASALFVTPKTIETHLNHTYRKLGVRSRTELTGRLTRNPAPPPSHDP